MSNNHYKINDGYFLKAVNDRIRSDIKNKITEKVMESVRKDIVDIIEEAMKDIETKVIANHSFVDWTNRFIIHIEDNRKFEE